MASLKDFRIDDDLAGAQQRAIEVVVTMNDGALRWCYFMTPAALASAGDWVPGTQVRFHYGAPHMIVVSELSADIISRVLRYLDRSGDLVLCTRAVEGAG
jgi:hypothetical protein